MRKKQAFVFSRLDMAKVAYERVDITTDVAIKTEMRKIANDDTVIPPQIVVGDKYCGVSILFYILFCEKFKKTSYMFFKILFRYCFFDNKTIMFLMKIIIRV